MPRVYVTSGHLKGEWFVCLAGETFDAMKMTPSEADAYADQIELEDESLAQVAAHIRKAADRCRREGMDA